MCSGKESPGPLKGTVLALQVLERIRAAIRIEKKGGNSRIAVDSKDTIVKPAVIGGY